MAVNDGLTVYNLIDGVVDEFHDETGVDTAENSATTNYDSSGDFYQNLSCLLYTSPSPRDTIRSRMPSSA